MSGGDHDPGTAAEHPSRSLFWSLVESGGLSLLSLAVLLVVARLAGPTELGAFAIAIGIVQLLTLVVEMLVHDAIIQQPRLTQDHLHTSFWVCLTLGIVLSAACWFGAPVIARMFGAESVSPLVAVAGLSLIASGAGCIPLALLRREIRFKPLAVRSLFGRLGGAIVAIVMVVAHYGVWALVAQHLVQAFLSVLFVWPAISWRPALRFSSSHLRELLSFGAYSVGTRIVWLSGGKIFVLLVANFAGVAAVGYLNIAQRVVDTLFSLLAGAVHNLALPILSRRQLDRPAFIRAYLQASEFTSFVTQPLFAGLGVCAASIVVVLLGEVWLPAAPVIQILACGAMIQFLVLFGPAATTALGRPGIVFALAVVTLALATAALLLLRPDDVVYAVAVWVGRTFVGGALAHMIVSRLLGVSPLRLLKAVWVPLGAAIVMVLALLAIEHQWLAHASAVTKLATMVPIGAMIYGGLVMLMGRQALSRLLQFAMAARRNPSLGASS